MCVVPDHPDWRRHLAFQTGLGIDIGHLSVAVAHTRGSVRKVRLGAHRVYPLDGEGPPEEKAGLIGDMAADFMKENRLSPTGVFVGIPRDRVIVRYVELPLAVRENLRDALGYEMEKYVPFSRDEVYFDFQVLKEDKEAGTMRVLLVAVRQSSVAPYFALTERLGVKLSGIEISSTAIANYLNHARDNAGDEPRAFLFLRHDRLELGLLKGNRLTYSRVLKGRGAGSEERDLISEGLNILKRVRGDGQARLRTFLCVSESESDMVELFREDEDLEVCLPDLSGAGLPTPAMIPAWGLALKGVVNLPMEINLLPQGLRKRPSKIGYYSMFFLGAMVVLTAGAWAGGTVFRHEQTVDRLDGELKKLTGEAVKIDQSRKVCERLTKRIDYLNSLRQGGSPVLSVIKELSQRIPKTAWVSSLTFSEKGLELEGQASSASELISLLDASPLFHDVVFLSAITKTRDGKERFRIGLKLG
ncbi:MAG TPA: hypothetical protein ENH37_13005 [Deltaproteobacteria bacterium]|nr:hypothetical protein [Deltaproteobacteria bacterium]